MGKGKEVRRKGRKRNRGKNNRENGLRKKRRERGDGVNEKRETGVREREGNHKFMLYQLKDN